MPDHLTPSQRADEIAATLPTLTDDEALHLIVGLMMSHRFAGYVMTATDVRNYLENSYFVCEDERTVTDVDVERILTSWEWTDGMDEAFVERGWEMLSNACDDAFDADGNLRPE